MKSNGTIKSIDDALKAVNKAHMAFSSHVESLKDNISEEDMEEIRSKLNISTELMKNRKKFESPEDVQNFLRKNNIM